MKIVIIGMPRAGTTSIHNLLKEATQYKSCRFKEPGFFLSHSAKEIEKSTPDDFVDATTDYFFETDRVISNSLGFKDLKYILLIRDYHDWKQSFLNRCNEFGMSAINDDIINYKGLFISKTIDISEPSITEIISNIKRKIPPERLKVINIFNSPDSVSTLMNWLNLPSDKSFHLKKLNQASGRLLLADRLAKFKFVRYCAKLFPFADVVYEFLRDVQSWFHGKR